MQSYILAQQTLKRAPRRWLITGVAGFIGSNILEKLLLLDQQVVGLDNFCTGSQKNLVAVKTKVSNQQWNRFSFIQGDICNISDCNRVVSSSGNKVDFILHHAALGSVPKSISNPDENHRVNVDGFVNLFLAALDSGVERFIYASSSAVYGDEPSLPKREEKIGNLLSPYAVSKRVNELYGDVFSRNHGIKTIGLRYFNVFGPRQNPEGAYAAVIPKWIASILRNETISINGDGETSRDFCYVDDAVQANILAATGQDPTLQSEVFNIGAGTETTLNQLYAGLQKAAAQLVKTSFKNPIYAPFREGDIRYSLADISKAKSKLGFLPNFDLLPGLQATIDWHIKTSSLTS